MSFFNLNGLEDALKSKFSLIFLTIVTFLQHKYLIELGLFKL